MDRSCVYLVLVLIISASSSTKALPNILKTILSRDGDTIDCVPVELQPAVSGLGIRVESPPKLPIFGAKVAQLWQQAGSCPNGSIPIRRTSKEEILHLSSLKKHRNGSRLNGTVLFPAAFTGHEYAIATLNLNQAYRGAQARINIQNPWVQNPQTEFSLAQLWVTAGGYANNDLNSIEAGWQVYKSKTPKLFIYWTRDAYIQTGCYNLLCKGFVQTNSNILLGGSLTPSTAMAQYELYIYVYKDITYGNWWLGVGNQWVGYWPASLFTKLANYATRVDWGGEIVNVAINGRHTTTDMGSGHWPNEGFGKAAYIRDIAYYNNAGRLVAATKSQLSPIISKKNCYDLKFSRDTAKGAMFYYGGPGYSAICR